MIKSINRCTYYTSPHGGRKDKNKIVLVTSVKTRYYLHKLIVMRRYKYVPGRPGVTLFDAVCEIDNLRLAHENASRGKKWYPEVKMVNKNPDMFLYAIQEMLLSGEYVNSEYNIFDRRENEKIRKIYKLPYYPDRIIQWALLQIIAPILEKTFTKDTYSSIPGRGPLNCMMNVSNALYKDPEGVWYCLKIDIHHFYQSINHDILKRKYLDIFKDDKLMWLICVIIDSVSENEGVPIGNYTSQYSGNLYLSEFDHWIKEDIGVKYYFRYMDDMVFLSGSKEFLHDLLYKIIERLDVKEKLELKSNYQIFPSKIRGIDYVGYRMFGGYALIRNRIHDRFVRLCKSLMSKDTLSEHDRSSLFSYVGFLQHANTYNLQEKYYIPIKMKFGLCNEIKTLSK